MAFWNAPLEDEKHASNAIEASKRMMRTIEIVNNQVKEDFNLGFDLKIGIGIGTGFCVVGNMGSDQRFDYTVLGDVVNLSSRLEGQTKAYGMTTVISSYTADEINHSDPNIVEIDMIKVKGKTEPETIFGVSTDEIQDEEKVFLKEFLNSYRKGDLSNAEEMLSKLIKVSGALVQYAKLMKDRLIELKADGLPKDWDGVYEAKTK